MVVSIEELRMTAMNLRKEGLNSQQIADELSLSQDTISWLLAGSQGDDQPSDVRIGWRTIGVKPSRISAMGTIMADVADEELGSGDGSGSLSSKYGQVSGKKVVIIDDVLSTGKTVSKTISAIKEAGGDVGLVIVLVNKTMRNEIGDVPLRGVIRAVSV